MIDAHIYKQADNLYKNAPSTKQQWPFIKQLGKFYGARQISQQNIPPSNVWILYYLEKSDELVHCSVKNVAVSYKNHRERVMQIELARLKKKKEKHFGSLATFWFGTLVMHFSATGCVVRHKSTRR